jgi:hypothetical protein
MSEPTAQKLQETIAAHGGLIFGLDGLQPEGHGTLLYVLYEVLSSTPVAGVQMEQATTEKLSAWLQAYQHYPALAVVSDGEDAIIAALQKTWPEAPHQRCHIVPMSSREEHFLGNVAEGALKQDAKLRKQMRQSLGGLPKVQQATEDPPFCDPTGSGVGGDREPDPHRRERCRQPGKS